MSAQELLDAIERRGPEALRPVLLALGEEDYLLEQLVVAVRGAACSGGVAGFNEDRFVAGESDVDRVIAAAQMLPMMAPRRFVLVRAVERWEGRSEETAGAKSKKSGESPLDKLAAYAAEPNRSTVLLVVGTKLHAQRRLVTAAKKGGFLVPSEPLKRPAVVAWAGARAKRLGHTIARDAVEQLVDALGTQLGVVADALERLSLYVGQGRPITEEAVTAVIAPVRQGVVWDLTDAVSARDRRAVLQLLPEFELTRGGDVMTLAAIASSVRKLAKFDALVASGEPAEQAALSCGIPRFRAQATRDWVRKLPRGTLRRWLILLAEADVAMKGGSRRSGRSVLESTLLAKLGGP